MGQWRRLPNDSRLHGLKTVPDDLKLHNSTPSEAIDMAHNQLLWRLLAANGITHCSWCRPEMLINGDV